MITARDILPSHKELGASALHLEMGRLGYNRRIRDDAAAVAILDGGIDRIVELGMIEPEDVDACLETFAGEGLDVPPADPSWDTDWSRWVPTEVMAEHFLEQELSEVGIVR